MPARRLLLRAGAPCRRARPGLTLLLFKEFPVSARFRLSLDGKWAFSPHEPLPPDFSNHCTQISVPAPWQADPRFRQHRGVAWYGREFHIPDEWLMANRVLILGFGAVDYAAQVWVNGVEVGAHEGGYLPFEFDITAAVRSGRNVVTVRVDDPPEWFDEIPHGKQSWYGMLSGLWQSVWVESRAATHIQGVKITAGGEQVSVEVRLSGALAGMLTAEVFAPDGRIAAQAEFAALRFSIPIEHPLPWSPDEPHLYTLKLCTGEDEVTETFGFRTIQTRNGQIWLNGKPFYLRGALDQDYYPEFICTPPSQEYIEAEFRQAKALGLNCLRVHIKVADPRYYAAADKVGLLIWTELPNHILLTEHAKRRARQTLAGMVERDWNHPSIGIWTIINESWGVDLSNPEHRAWLAEMYDFMKALDPTRLVVGNSACWGNFNVVSDLDDYHMYFAMPDHHEQWRAWVAAFASRPWWTYACAYENAAAWQEYLRAPWQAAPRLLAPEARRRGDEPLLVSEFGNWGLPDVEKLVKGYGGEPWWFETGLEWGDGVVYPHGVEGRFRDYAFDRVFPSLAALAAASQELQFAAMKYEIEQIRRHNAIQGYVITELTDVHWECNGLLDMLRNPKTYFEKFHCVNADDVLIPLWERLSVAGGETCALPVLLAHCSAQAVQGAALEWEVRSEQYSDGGKACEWLSGRLEVGECTPFDVTELGMISFSVPPVKKPTRARLGIKLTRCGEMIAETEQDFLFLPKVAPWPLLEGLYAPDLRVFLAQQGISTVDDLAHARVAVVSTLDDACRDFLLRGGKVLFLAEQPDSLRAVLPGLSIAPRAGTPWQGDWASSFGWHRFESLPTNGVVDFSFAGLTPEHVIHGFAPRDFARDVLAGLFVGWIHKPIPTIARRRMGRGVLVVSTFRLRENLENNPLARFLLAELLRLF
ncbi:MAG: glycoside hydrolase family 2 [Anaerolineae bacterium]|nr:MAG: glycoside hydrolase family 2 [Anaerolineae bacterium]